MCINCVPDVNNDFQLYEFYNPQTTLIDHPDTISFIIYTHVCNWNCYGCYNKTVLSKPDMNIKITLNQLIKKIKKSMIQLLILSGGETLLLKDLLIPILRTLKAELNIPIRIDTNGTSPNFMEYLKCEQLVDGFAVDVKLPYWNMATVSKLSKTILGVDSLDVDQVIKSMKIADGMDYTLYRSVRYPVLSDEILDDISKYMKMNFKSNHYINPFYNMPKGDLKYATA